MATSSGLRPMSIAMTREIMMVTRDISVDSRAAVAMTRETRMPTREMLVLGRPGGSLLGLRPMSIAMTREMPTREMLILGRPGG